MTSKLTDEKLAVEEPGSEPAVSEASPRPGADEETATPSRRRAGRMVLPHAVPPRELAGKWVAWSRRQIVAHGDTLAEVMDRVASEEIKGASYELLPSLSRGH